MYVDPMMAVLCAVLAGAGGVFIFVKRNYWDKKKTEA